MANTSGHVYGLTLLCPILQEGGLDVSHAIALRDYLATLPRDHTSPFARFSGTHLARLVVMDDVVFVGLPAHEEHLKSRYLVFETNFDGDLESYLSRMVTDAGDFVDSVWKHCVGYPGVKDIAAFIAYMKKCQIETTFFFADVNNHTVAENLKALQVQAEVAHFIERHQGEPPEEVQRAFGRLLQVIANTPAPLPGELPREGRTSYAGRPHAARVTR
jgi:hypothetical protein